MGEGITDEGHALEDDVGADDGGDGADDGGGKEAAAHELELPGVSEEVGDLRHG